MARYKGRNAIKRFEANVRRRRQAFKRVMARGIFEGIRDRTPQDTGVARADWRMKARTPDLRPALDPIPELRGLGTPISPPPTPKLPKRLALHQPIFITNPQKYIQYLENGTSDQAPNGMVRVTLREFQDSAEELAGRIKVAFEGSEEFDLDDDVV